ncbi:AbrB family transcriptional regulator [Saccharolobus solfataricus]|uniref:AbrB family transcriptional regulator n=1 Tax=Saccharolobus solfataricus TaxID=2287 RepID=A0A157SY58_SACSO|nr:AbrB family transcriptional regulator [Saccharolobus solfataricus]
MRRVGSKNCSRGGENRKVLPVEEVVKVSRNYQVTIPAKVRQKFPVKEGDLVKVIYDENEGVVKIQILKS